MRHYTILTTVLAALTSVSSAENEVLGFQIAGIQPNSHVQTAKANGAKFVLIGCTDGLTNPSTNYTGLSIAAGISQLIRGAYHIARPNASPGSTQAAYFSSNAGIVTTDGSTLPGTVRFQAPSSGATNACYGLTQSAMSSWIRDFGAAYNSRNNRWPMIQTTATWWNQCVGGNPPLNWSNQFVLHLVVGPVFSGWLPVGWQSFQFLQFTRAVSPLPNQVQWIGNFSALQSFAQHA